MLKKIFGFGKNKPEEAIVEEAADRLTENSDATEEMIISDDLSEAAVNEDKEEEKFFQESSEVIEETEHQSEESESSMELSFFEKLKLGLTKTSRNLSKKIDELFLGYSKIDDEIFDELEELLILADLGFETVLEIVKELKKRAAEKKIEEVSKLESELEAIIEEFLVAVSDEKELRYETPTIVVVVGVNGVGKTTSIGKIASQLKKEGKSVMLAAGDTFRAAAAEQLNIWANRSESLIVKSNEGADPSAVIFDAIKSAQSKNVDVLICDTAGRLHNKKNLMMELEKIFKVIAREYPQAHREVFLVIDATTGQNALNQAKLFSDVAPLTGIVLTKLDGTAKGGVVIGLSRELNVPIRYVGVGEKIDDLQKFNAREFARALFEKN